MDPLLFLGSLAAILALAGVARWLGLGRAPRLANEAEARAAANEAVDGFEPVRIALDREGAGAIMEAPDGRLLLLKPHGNFFAARTGARIWTVVQNGQRLTIDSGERRFGKVSLLLDEPAYWVAAIERLKAGGNA
ncbi:hypothetical protein LY632_01780 [Erythrobacter sp. SDW2]|uniref:hypothetical protein n=1 Tax=Erythrobacter sp. SDW2 TaxID=2907154 RepID=UPI001F2B9B20|nr:hypothetical protein [Erythrobacter sp. SDW2]UIP07156.1 hypothetical protein LY632_01780 [Erythrobacter sp. SDW2]